MFTIAVTCFPRFVFGTGLDCTAKIALINNNGNLLTLAMLPSSVLPLGSVSLTSDCCLFQHQITSDFYVTVS